ncbi:putative Bet v I/Major latex protein [Helianthus debilis subsp. tardiflorus]
MVWGREHIYKYNYKQFSSLCSSWREREMSLSGKRVVQVEIKSRGDVFHELWKSNPHQIPSLTPTNIQNCQTHDGEVGTVGSVLFWNYSLGKQHPSAGQAKSNRARLGSGSKINELAWTGSLILRAEMLSLNMARKKFESANGKDCVVKTLVKDINEAKKSVTFEVIEGDLLEQYKTFVLHIHVDKHGVNNLVTWTVEYEKLNPNVPDPDSLMEFYKKVAKDIETHHLKN